MPTLYFAPRRAPFVRRNQRPPQSKRIAIGAASITEADDSLLADGLIAANQLILTEDDDALLSAGALPIAGALSIAEAADQLSSAGLLIVTANVDVTEADDVAAATAILRLRRYLSGRTLTGRQDLDIRVR